MRNYGYGQNEAVSKLMWEFPFCQYNNSVWKQQNKRLQRPIIIGIMSSISLWKILWNANVCLCVAMDTAKTRLQVEMWEFPFCKMLLSVLCVRTFGVELFIFAHWWRTPMVALPVNHLVPPVNPLSPAFTYRTVTVTAPAGSPYGAPSLGGCLINPICTREGGP